MGIINHDGYDWEYLDTPITDTYITLYNNPIIVRKTVGEDSWLVTAGFYIYRNLAALTAGKRYIATTGIDLTLTTEELNSKKIRDHVYDRLKELFPNYTELEDE